MRLIAACSLLLLASLTSARADEYFANSDFSQGAASWSGDTGTDDLGNTFAKNANGLPLPLQADSDTRIYQTIHTDSPFTTFTLVCTPAAGTKFTGEGKVAHVAKQMPAETASNSYVDPITGLERTVFNPNYQIYSSSFRDPELVIIDCDANTVSARPLRINAFSPQTQTATLGMPFTPHHPYIIYVAFPPGDGTITLNKISLVPSDPPQEVANAFTPVVQPPPTEADNLLAKQNWSGDVGDDSSDDALANSSLDSSSSDSEATLRMKGGSITEISKSFRPSSSIVRLMLTATPSAHCELNTSSVTTSVAEFAKKMAPDSLSASDSVSSSSGPGATMAGNMNPQMGIGDFMAILIDQKTNQIVTGFLSINRDKAEAQASDTSIQVNANDDYKLYLVLPTGHGNYTISHVNLSNSVATNPYATAPPSPQQ